MVEDTKWSGDTKKQRGTPICTHFLVNGRKHHCNTSGQPFWETGIFGLISLTHYFHFFSFIPKNHNCKKRKNILGVQN